MRLRVGSPSGARAGSPAGIGPFIAALVLGLALVFTADLGAQIRPDLERLLDEGLSLAQQDRLDEASKVFEKALLLDPTSEEALEWVERVGLHHLFKVIRSGSDSLASQMGTLIRLTTIETKRRSSEPERIAEVLQEYFMTDDVMKKYKLLMTSVSEHGVYLIPGIVERLGEPEQDLRVRAIRALTRISDDAVMPLTRVLHHPDPRVVLGAIASLQKIKNPAAVPSLKWVAESSDDMIIRQAALDVARAIAPRISEESAYGLLQMQAKRFYSDSGYMSRTYHDAVIWELKDGALSFRNVHSWALNELRAQQLLEDAITLDPGASEAHVLNACNLLARFAEYRTVRDVINEKVERGDLDESRKADLQAESLEMVRVRNRAYRLAPEILTSALDLAMTDRRPEVAIEAIGALRNFIQEGSRAQAVHETLDRAQRYDNRGVRFAASECIAFMNPASDFPGAGNVVPNLVEGLLEGGGRVALTVFPDEEDALHVRGLLRRANFSAFNDSSGIDALRRAMSFPKDLIVLSVEIGDYSTAQVIGQLRKDYRTKHVPILVISEDDDLAQNREIYMDEETGVQVLGRSIDAERLRENILQPLFMHQDDARARSAAIASRAAKALHFLSSRGQDTIFDIAQAESALVSALESPEDSVRIPVCRALACLGSARASEPIVRIFEENSSVELQVAALRALGDINRENGSLDPSVDRILQAAMKSDDVRIMKAAARAKGLIGRIPGAKPAVFTDE